MTTSGITVRRAEIADAASLCAVINPIIAKGGTTAFRVPFDPESIAKRCLTTPLGLSCFLAEDTAGVQGFQYLLASDPAITGAGALPPDWGSIATFVAEGQQGRGIGRSLFAATLDAARSAGIAKIDATIRRENTGGQRFYDGLGFVEYRSNDLSISRVFDIR